MPKKVRYDYIDCAKLIGIALLLIEHTKNWINLEGPIQNVKVWICSFHMALFFFVYGMVASRNVIKEKKDILKFIERRFIALVVPYILWCFIYATGFGSNFFKGLVYGTNKSLTSGGTNAVLWFLPVMFLSAVLYQLSVNMEAKFKPSHVRYIAAFELIAAMSASYWLKKIPVPQGLPWGIDIAFTGFALMLIGRYVILPVINKLSTGNRLFMALCMCICIVCGFIAAQHNIPEGMNVVIMAWGAYGKSYLAFMAISLVNTFGILCLSHLISNKVMAWIGRGSIVIMAGHYIMFPYSIALLQIVMKSVTNVSAYGLLFPLLNSILCVIAFIPVIAFINKYAPPLGGKNSPR